MASTEWNTFAEQLTWRAVLDEYGEALSRVEYYCMQHADSPTMPGEVFLAVASIRALYDGLRPIIMEPSRYDEPAESTMVEAVLAAVRRTRRALPSMVPVAMPANA